MKSTGSAGGWPQSRKTSVLIDRCVSKGLARGLRTFGFHVVTLDDVYGDDGQRVEDVQWITDAGRHGYIAITANPAIVFVAHERAAVLAAGTKVFCIGNPQQTRDGRALIVGRHLLRILRRARRDGPCFWRLYPGDQVIYDIP